MERPSPGWLPAFRSCGTFERAPWALARGIGKRCRSFTGRGTRGGRHRLPSMRAFYRSACSPDQAHVLHDQRVERGQRPMSVWATWV
jgi:hypothetical protein